MSVSRLDLLHALVYQKTFVIDSYQTNTVDKSFDGSHFYCDKAPGVVFLAFPGFYVSAKVLSVMGIPPNSPKGCLISSWVCVALSLGLITSFGVVCLFLWLQGFMNQRVALLSTFVSAFGSGTFPHATMLMSHAVVVGLISIALYFLRLGHYSSSKVGGENQFNWRDCFSGAACGLAIACEYDSALVVGGILAMVHFSNAKRGVHFILGAVLPLLLIPIYNWICTGNPVSLPYAHEVTYTEMGKGFYGIHLPSTHNIVDLLFSPERGLFFWTPFFLLAFVGYPSLCDKSPSLFLLCYGISIFQVVIISGYFLVQGGSIFGPRFLTPIIPFLILPAGIGACRLPYIAVLLAALSIIATGGATLISAFPHGDNPLFHFYFDQFLEDNFSPNFGEVVGLKGSWELLPLLLMVASGVWYLWRQNGINQTSKPPNEPLPKRKINA